MSTQDNEDKLSKAVKKLSKLKNLNKCTVNLIELRNLSHENFHKIQCFFLIKKRNYLKNHKIH